MILQNSLNRSRLLIGRVLLLLALTIVLFSSSYLPQEALLHHLNHSIGLVLISLCILGRFYCTLFIGGRKNEELVTTGPFSVVRNPLYLCSLLGIIGIGFTSNQLSVLIILVVGMLLMYLPLVRQEEAFLQEKFGQAYTQYCALVPRFIPSPTLYQSPKEIIINMRRIHSFLRDALWWLTPVIIIDLIEWSRNAGVTTPMGSLW
ncbi:MAG: isoprenylcysteine carboxylmethyltransferase family protein [Alphaproteobacteria bacterium]|nr:isoprenylcysteine carboxylmethyltransferase family protein [Alphaproteobacteria bacterium]